MRCATMTDKSGAEYVFCSGGKGGKKSTGGKKPAKGKMPPKKAPAKKDGGGKKPAPPKLPPMSDKMLMSKFGGHTTAEIVEVLRPMLGKSKAGKDKAEMGPWTKLSKLQKLQKAGGLTKLSISPAKKGQRNTKGLAGSPRGKRAKTPTKKKPAEGKPPKKYIPEGKPTGKRMARREAFASAMPKPALATAARRGAMMASGSHDPVFS